MDYQQIANTVADSLLSYTKDESGWKTCKRTNEVTVYWRPSTEFPGNLYKGDGVISGSPEKVWECLKPVPNGFRVKWDNNVKKFELIETVNDDVSVYRTVTPSAAMGIISPRDFVDVVLVKQYEDGTITSNATHVGHPGCPAQSGYVRGFNHPCGCFCVPIPGPLLVSMKQANSLRAANSASRRNLPPPTFWRLPYVLHGGPEPAHPPPSPWGGQPNAARGADHQGRSGRDGFQTASLTGSAHHIATVPPW